MIGAITAWSGSIASIPAGWALCNGSNGTPDLRDRFVIGVGSSHSLNTTGGAATVSLSEANLPAHTHTLSGASAAAIGNHTHTHILPNSLTPIDFRDYLSGSISSFSTPPATIFAGGDHTHSFSGTFGNNTTPNTAHENLPPYYALAFIMAVA